MQKILVTGGAGFIGGHFVEAALDRGIEVVVLDSLVRQVHNSQLWPDVLRKTGRLETARSIGAVVPRDGVTLVRGDVREWRDVMSTLRQHAPDAIVHLAAEVGVGQAEYELPRYVDTNVNGTANLLQALDRAYPTPSSPIPVFVAGSMSAYGEGAYISHYLSPNQQQERIRPSPRGALYGSGGSWDYREMSPTTITESDDLKPQGIYAATKAWQEEMALLWGKRRQDRFRVTVGRFFNVIGERQALSNPYTGVAAIFSNAIRAGERPVVFEDGKQSRDFIHVSDVVEGIFAMLKRGSGVYNVCTGSRSTLLDLLEALGEAYGVDPNPVFPGTFRAGDIRHCYGDPSCLISLGWSARFNLKASVRRLAEWANEQPVFEGVQAMAVEELARKGMTS